MNHSTTITEQAPAEAGGPPPPRQRQRHAAADLEYVNDLARQRVRYVQCRAQRSRYRPHVGAKQLGKLQVNAPPEP